MKRKMKNWVKPRNRSLNKDRKQVKECTGNGGEHRHHISTLVVQRVVSQVQRVDGGGGVF